MTHKTSGELQYSKVKGLLHVDAAWWIDTGLRGWAFRLLPYGVSSDALCSYMDSDGRLHAAPGYLYDGTSRPILKAQTPVDATASLVHDLLYEAMRARKLPTSLRGEADRLYRDLLIERDMSRVRAWTRYIGLRLFGRGSASPRNGPEYPRRVAN